MQVVSLSWLVLVYWRSIAKANNIKIYNKNKGSVKEPFGFNNAMSYFLKIVIPKMKLTTTITTNTKNINLAMEAAPAAMPASNLL